jgi:FMN phosphatase YigB (HAD superfamily)
MRWVVFDIGGVLARIRANWYDCAVAAGLEPDRKLREGGMNAFPLFDPFQKGTASQDRYIAELSQLLECDLEKAALAHNEILVEPFRGTEQIVDALNEQEIGTACLSNTNEMHWRILDDPELYPNIAKLQLKVVSHLVGALKPSPEIYADFERLAGSRMENERESEEPEPVEIVYFEDHPDYVQAAIERGWDAVLIKQFIHPEDQIRSALTERGITV